MNADLEQFSPELDPGTRPGAASYVTGALGALLGGMVGAIPLVVVGALLGLFSGWLGFLIGFAAVKGYTLFHGAKKHSYAMAVVVCTSCLVVLASCALCAVISFSANPDVQQVAERWDLSVYQVAWSVFVDNIGLVIVSFALPIIVSAVGIFMARSKLTDYTQPEQLKQAVQAAEQVLSRDTGTSLYFANVAFRGVMLKYQMLFFIPLMTFFMVCLFLFITPATMEIFNAYPAVASLMLPLLMLSLVVFLIIMYCQDFTVSQSISYCYARDGQGTVWRVNLLRLNTIPTYQYGSFSGLTQFNIEKLTQEQRSMVQASVLRAIQDIQEGRAYPGSVLTSIVVPMENLEILKDRRMFWRCAYTNRYGQRKKASIGKAYPGFHPLDDREAAPIPNLGAKPVIACVFSAFIAILFFMLMLVYSSTR